jgi:hypothetical protein
MRGARNSFRLVTLKWTVIPTCGTTLSGGTRAEEF